MNSNDPIRTVTSIMENLADAAEQIRPKTYRSEEETLDDWKRRLWALDILVAGALAMDNGFTKEVPIIAATALQVEATREWAYATMRMREAEEEATKMEEARRAVSAHQDGVGSVSVA